MWNNQASNPYGPQSTGTSGGSSSNQQKYDIFVGNLAFATTEEQLHQVFSEIGRVIKVRMVSDMETGKPRGFAFVEFEDPQAALSAIRNMNDYDLNGRKLRVNFSNSSHLETLAGQLGMDMTKKDANVNIAPNLGSAPSTGATGIDSTQSGGADVGTQAVAAALKGMSKGEMYDVVSKLKEIADKDPEEARKIISGHPQLPEALLFLMSQLDMIKSPIPNSAGAPPPAMPIPVPQPAVPPPPTARSDPRDPRARQDPRDPRSRGADPRAHMHSAPPPQQPTGSIAGLDPTLVNQVMGLTPAQIQQLPVEKQQSILALRQQIENARGGM